jgi:hypothetical protein
MVDPGIHSFVKWLHCSRPIRFQITGCPFKHVEQPEDSFIQFMRKEVMMFLLGDKESHLHNTIAIITPSLDTHTHR